MNGFSCNHCGPNNWTSVKITPHSLLRRQKCWPSWADRRGLYGCWCLDPAAWTETLGTEDTPSRTWTRTPPVAGGTPPVRTQILWHCSAAEMRKKKQSQEQTSACGSSRLRDGSGPGLTSISTDTVTSFFRFSHDTSESRSEPCR